MSTEKNRKKWHVQRRGSDQCKEKQNTDEYDSEEEMNWIVHIMRGKVVLVLFVRANYKRRGSTE